MTISFAKEGPDCASGKCKRPSKERDETAYEEGGDVRDSWTAGFLDYFEGELVGASFDTVTGSSKEGERAMSVWQTLC